MDTKNDNNKDDAEDFAFDWKKKGFDNKERLTLKTDVNEAEKYNHKKENASKKNKVNPENLPLGLKKLRKKIRDIYDEDDEDENDYVYSQVKMPEQEEDNVLLNALNDDEKRMFRQKNTIENTRMQQDAGKMEALHIANNLAREAGLKNLSRKVLDAGMQQATFNPQETQEKIIKKEVGGKLGIRGKLEDGKIIQAARGIKKVEQLGGQKAAKNLDMKEVVKAGEDKLTDRQLAELILEKSGQDVKLNKKQKNKGSVELKHFEHAPEKQIKRNKNTKLGR